MKIFILFLCLLLTACASDPKYKVQKPFLFKVTKEGQSGYLFGTMHRGVSDIDLPTHFWSYFDNSDAFAFEFDATDDKSVQRDLVVLLVHSNPDYKLKKLMAPEDFEKLKVIFKKELPDKYEYLLDSLTAFGAYVILGEVADSQKFRLDRGEHIRMNSKFMLDKELLERAKKADKIVTFLDRNPSGLKNCLLNDQKYFLQKMSDFLNDRQQGPNALESYRQLVDVYRRGSIEDLRKLETIDGIPANHCLLAVRNEMWLGTVVGMLEGYQSPFIAVGVAHLGYSKGTLIDLLIERGYVVQRVDTDLH